MNNTRHLSRRPHASLALKAQSWGSFQTARKILSPSLITLSILRIDYGVSEVIRRTKANYSAPAEVGDEEAMGWDAVLSQVGD